MGRTKLGEDRVSYTPRTHYRKKKLKKQFTTVDFPVSRRRPYGAYSVLDLCFGATARQIESSYNNLVAALRRQISLFSGQQLSAARKKLKELHLANRCLTVCKEEYDKKYFNLSPVTIRVRKHRKRLTKREKSIVSARTVTRRLAKSSRLARFARSTPRTMGVKKKYLSGGKQYVGKLVGILRTNANNSWLVNDRLGVLLRSNAEKQRDRRKKNFVVRPLSTVKYFSFPGARFARE